MSSRSLVLQKYYRASIRTRSNWIFNLKSPGKLPILDGRTSAMIDTNILLGESYVLKLLHMVDGKLNSLAKGPYSLTTQQPLQGRSRKGGQRVGEIEAWALERFGAVYVLQEMFTVKSSDARGREKSLEEALWRNEEIPTHVPDAFRVLVCRIQALCLDLILYS